jgi:hypothetical protein
MKAMTICHRGNRNADFSRSFRRLQSVFSGFPLSQTSNRLKPAKRPAKATVTLLLLLLLILPLSAETFLYQGFEQDASDTWPYIADPPGSRLIYWGRLNQTLNGVSAQAGAWYWASWDLDNTEGSLTFGNAILPTGYTYTLSFHYYTLGLNPATEFSRYSLSYDGGATWN